MPKNIAIIDKLILSLISSIQCYWHFVNTLNITIALSIWCTCTWPIYIVHVFSFWKKKSLQKNGISQSNIFSLQCYTQHVHVLLLPHIALKHVILLHVHAYYHNRHVHVSHVCCVSVYSFGHNSCVLFDFRYLVKTALH